MQKRILNSFVFVFLFCISFASSYADINKYIDIQKLKKDNYTLEKTSEEEASFSKFDKALPASYTIKFNEYENSERRLNFIGFAVEMLEPFEKIVYADDGFLVIQEIADVYGYKVYYLPKTFDNILVTIMIGSAKEFEITDFQKEIGKAYYYLVNPEAK